MVWWSVQNFFSRGLVTLFAYRGWVVVGLSFGPLGQAMWDGGMEASYQRPQGFKICFVVSIWWVHSWCTEIYRVCKRGACAMSKHISWRCLVGSQPNDGGFVVANAKWTYKIDERVNPYRCNYKPRKVSHCHTCLFSIKSHFSYRASPRDSLNGQGERLH